MKQFKKALSLTLAVVMLVSVCAIAIGTFGVSATTIVDATSDNIFSLEHNTYVYDFKDGSTGNYMTAETATVNSYRTDPTATNVYPIVHNVVSNMVATATTNKSYLSPTDGGMVLYGTQTINDDKYGLTGQFYHKMAFKDPDVRRDYSADTNNIGKYYARLEKGKYYILQAELGQLAGAATAQAMFVTHVEDQVIGKGQDVISYAEPVAGDTVITATYECNTDARNGDFVLLAVNGTVIVKSFTMYEFDAAAVKAYYDGITAGDDVKIKFDNGAGDFFAPQGSNITQAKYAVVDDPLDSGRGNVLKSEYVNTENGGYGFSIPAAPGLGGYANVNYSEGYEFKSGHKYYISFDVYHDMSDKGTPGAISVYAAKEANVAASGGKGAVINSTYIESVNLSNKVGAWGTYAGTFTYNVDGTTITSDMVHPYFSLTGVTGHVMYWDNITIIDLGAAPTTVGTITLSGIRDNTTDSVIEITQEQVNAGTVVNLPRLADTEDHIFAGWTTDWYMANDAISGSEALGGFKSVRAMNKDYASTLRATAKAENVIYFAIWVDRSYTITFGKTDDADYPYLYDSKASTEAQQKMLEQVSASNGYVSKGWKIQDVDGDGDYELCYSSTAGAGYKVALGEYDSVLGHNRFVNVHEGVTYKFKINMKVNTLSNGHVYIYMTRYRGGDFSQTPLDGTTKSGATIVHTLSATGAAEFTTDGFMVQGLYDMGNNGSTGTEGNTNAMARTIKNQLALQMYNGDVVFESIEIIADSWTDTESGIINDNNKGTVSIENGKITVTPKPGYAVASNGIKVQRTRNYQTSLAYAEDIQAAVAKNAAVAAVVDNRSVFSYEVDLGDKYVEGETMITVEYYETSDDVKGLTKYAQSIRQDLVKDENNLYRSAGLRFRANLTYDQKASAVEMGFVVVPDNFITDKDNWYRVTDGVATNENSALVDTSLAGKAIVAPVYRAHNKTTGQIDGENLIRIEYHNRTGTAYENDPVYDQSKDYQVIITGLTREELGNTQTLKDVKFSAVMYVVKSDGSVTYYHVADSISYNMVDAALSN